MDTEASHRSASLQVLNVYKDPTHAILVLGDDANILWSERIREETNWQAFYTRKHVLGIHFTGPLN
jgi:hypothetical protein